MAAKKPPKNDPRKAIAYLRVSTDRQEHGPEAQRAVLETWASREGVQIVEWFSEEESGASEINDRPELVLALEAMRIRKAGLFLAAKRDRLAREVVIAREIGARARARGGMVVTADGMSDVDNKPDAFLKQGISDLFAEHERRQIADRTRQGLDVMRSKGFRTGNTPYGFQAAAKGPLSKRSGRPLPLEPNPDEQAICAYVMRLHEQGWGPRRIERDLRARRYTSRGGGLFVLVQVQRIIRNCASLRKLFPEHAGGGDPAPIARAIPVTDPELDAPDGAIVDGMQRVGDTWHPAKDPAPQKVLACGRGHVFEDPRAENSYCTRAECAAGRGTYTLERRIEWRALFTI